MRLFLAPLLVCVVPWLTAQSTHQETLTALWAERLTSIVDLKDASSYDRICMLEAGLYMIEERPFFGLGPDMVRNRYSIYRHPSSPRFWVPHLHNSWLQMAAERGLMTLAACCALFGMSLRSAWRGYTAKGKGLGGHADLHLAVLLSLSGFCVAGFFENNWGDTEVQRIVLSLLAIPICLANSIPPKKAEE